MKPRLEELMYLYEKLSLEERDELLQCLLIAAPRGGKAMIKVLEDLLLCHATKSCWASTVRPCIWIRGAHEWGGGTREMLTVLGADAPSEEHAPQLMLYGQFVGA